MDFNKIFAAVLVAGIVAMLSGFVSEKLFHSYPLEKDAVEIDGGAVQSAGGAAAPSGPDPIMHLIATADVTRGQKISKACAACHSYDKGGPNKVGPNLWNVTGGPKAGKAGFSYSDALRETGGAWGYESMNAFLWKPKKYAPGTKMNYIGLKKPQDRADLIAWLRTLADRPMPLPNDAEIAAEAAAFVPPVEAEAPPAE